jgi:hypothetical protein
MAASDPNILTWIEIAHYLHANKLESLDRINYDFSVENTL